MRILCLWDICVLAFITRRGARGAETRGVSDDWAATDRRGVAADLHPRHRDRRGHVSEPKSEVHDAAEVYGSEVYAEVVAKGIHEEKKHLDPAKAKKLHEARVELAEALDRRADAQIFIGETLGIVSTWLAKPRKVA